MNIRIFIVVIALTGCLALTTMSFKSSGYQPRKSSKIDEVCKTLIPGGKFAAGMAEYIAALKVNVKTGIVSLEEYNSALDASMVLQSKRSVNSVWNELGPDNVGGRTRAFLQDKDTASLMFVGGVSGGLFRSTTKGGSWKPINDYQENLNVSCIAQNTNGIILYGTGEGEFAAASGDPGGTSFQGNGVFRSTDRGRNFTRVNATTAYGNINSMAAEKSGGSRVYISTSSGLRYSDDGLTWTMGKNGLSKEVKVASNGVVYAQSSTNIVKSIDRGQSWTTITPPASNIGRASLAISPQDPNYLYVMASFNGRLDGVYRTTDGGTKWEQIILAGTSYFDPLVSGTNPQGSYDNVITVDPLDKNHIIMGGAALAEWREGNNPKYIASQNDFGGNASYVHSDKHVLEWDMTTTPPTIIIGTDGGLFSSSDNLKTFTNRNRGFNVTQFYAVAGDYEGNVVGGSQDNGTQYINKKGNTTKSAVEIKGGDGFHVEISGKNNAIVFSEVYYGAVTRSNNFGKSQSCVWDRRISRSFPTLTDTSKYCEYTIPNTWAPFNTKIRLWEHPSYDSLQSRLFIARYGQLWMALNPTDFQKEPEWYLVSTLQGNNTVWDIEVTNDGNSAFISNNSSIYRIDGLNSATYYKWSSYLTIPPGITVTNLNFNLGGGRAITSVNLDPKDNNIALITLANYGGSGYVYRGNNMLGAATYTNITNNLPFMPVYDGIISLNNSNLLFVGTELGVYASDDGGSTWTAQTNSTNKFPKVATYGLRQYYFPNRSSGSIYAGTHGRGFFECQQYKTSINTSLFKTSNTLISAFPNPADNEANFKINLKEGDYITLTIVDLTGKTVLVKTLGYLGAGENILNIETAGISAGTYVVTTKGVNTNAVLKLVVRH